MSYLVGVLLPDPEYTVVSLLVSSCRVVRGLPRESIDRSAIIELRDARKREGETGGLGRVSLSSVGEFLSPFIEGERDLRVPLLSLLSIPSPIPLSPLPVSTLMFSDNKPRFTVSSGDSGGKGW